MSWQVLETWWPLLLGAAALGAVVFMRVLCIYAEREIMIHDTAKEATELYIEETRRRAEQAARRQARREAMQRGS